MTTATRLDTDLSHWAPITRHYAVDGGYLAVTAHRFLTAEGTDIYLCDERAVAASLQPIAEYPEGTTHTAALESLGYTVIDTIGDEPEPDPKPDMTPQEQSVLDMLPPQIAAMVATAATQETPQ